MSVIQSGVNDISTIFPNLIAEWDYEKNGDLTPEMVSAHSNKKIWWKCERGHSFYSSPDHRSKGRNCPFCSGKRVLPGFNDMATTVPLFAEEWDYEKNGELKPTMLTAGSKVNVWWRCPKCGHSWSTSPNSRKYGTRGCPKCAEKQRVVSFRKAFLKEGQNDLVSQASEVLKEWDYELNQGINPADFTVNSKEKVWWKCNRCGKQWQAAINNRVLNKSGCPKCMKHAKTSFPEQAILYYVRMIYPSAENSYTGIKAGSLKELDVYIPDLNIGIEYDGIAWHRSDKSQKKDHDKFILCKDKGITLIRISEFERERSECDYLIIRSDSSSEALDCSISKLLAYLGITNINVDVERDRPVIMQQYITYIAGRSIASKYPEDVKYWDEEKNRGLTAEMISATSNVSYWWKCDLGHSYKAAPTNRLGTGDGCPFCSGRRVLPGFDDLQTRYPNIASQWSHTRNGSLKPTEVAPGSQQKVWWECEKGHQYQCIILNKVTTDMPCPYCSNRLTLKGFNDLETTDPALVAEWDYNKNIHINPTKVNRHSCRKAWWKCKEGHSWEAAINTRAKGSGCPFCCNKYVLPGYNDLFSTQPALAKEWDYEKNVGISPDSVLAGGAQKIWWKCDRGHSWEASIASRISAHTGCPYCANQKFESGYNDLKTLYPELAKEWNYEKNDGLLPENVIAGGTKRVWWKCAQGHEWASIVSSRINGRGCPYCSNKKLLPGYNDFATVYPDHLSEWNYEKNGDIRPENISCGSMTKVWWKCSKGHEWYMSPNTRRRQDGSLSKCYYCAGKKAIPGETDLATTRPDLINEWDYEKNTDISPLDVKEFSVKKVWWKCSECGLEWQALISKRASGVGCPSCKGKGAVFKRKVVKVETGEVYNSILDAVKISGCDRRGISDCCAGRRETEGGYHWAFYEEMKNT